MPDFLSSQLIMADGEQQSVMVQKTDKLAVKATGVSVPAGQTGILSVRTNNTDGTLTMDSAGHGITNGQRFDLFWNGGQRYHCVAGTVAGTSVPFTSSGGGGVNLPSAASAVTAGISTQVTFAVTGDNLTALFAKLPPSCVGYFVWATGGPADVNPQYVVGGTPYGWYTGLSANPFAGVTIATLWMSHNNSAQAITPSAVAICH